MEPPAPPCLLSSINFVPSRLSVTLNFLLGKKIMPTQALFHLRHVNSIKSLGNAQDHVP